MPFCVRPDGTPGCRHLTEAEAKDCTRFFSDRFSDWSTESNMRRRNEILPLVQGVVAQAAPELQPIEEDDEEDAAPGVARWVQAQANMHHGGNGRLAHQPVRDDLPVNGVRGHNLAAGPLHAPNGPANYALVRGVAADRLHMIVNHHHADEILQRGPAVNEEDAAHAALIAHQLAMIEEQRQTIQAYRQEAELGMPARKLGDMSSFTSIRMALAVIFGGQMCCNREGDGFCALMLAIIILSWLVERKMRS